MAVDPDELALDTISPTLTVLSPADGSVVGEVFAMSDAEVREAVARSAEAQVRWAEVSVKSRASRVAALAEALVAESDALVALIVQETSKTPIEALTSEVFVAVDRCLHLARHAESLLADHPIELGTLRHRRCYVRYAPMGVVAVISPWSSPLAVPFASVVEALLAGDGVVVKPSEFAPLTMLKVREIALECGLPEGLFEVVTGDAEAARALVSAGVARVVFTGSSTRGREVAVACAHKMIPCALTLSGSGPLIARADCDVERTAAAIVYGAFAHGGQSCASVERVYAHHAVHEPLVARVVALTRALRVGDPSRAEVDVGAIAHPRQLEHLDALVRDATGRGAVISAGGRRIETHGCYVEPTVLTRCDHAMRVMREELFGPVVAIMRVESDEAAVALANDSPYGLCAYVFSRDLARAEALAERVHAGTVSVNDVLSTYAAVEAPFGAIKRSGGGRASSEEALRAMCHPRTVQTEGRFGRAGEGLWFPYKRRNFTLARAALRALFGRHGIFGPIADLF